MRIRRHEDYGVGTGISFEGQGNLLTAGRLGVIAMVRRRVLSVTGTDVFDKTGIWFKAANSALGGLRPACMFARPYSCGGRRVVLAELRIPFPFAAPSTIQ